MPVIGEAKSGWDRDRLIKRARDSLAHHGGIEAQAADRLCGLLRYVGGDYADNGGLSAPGTARRDGRRKKGES